MLVLGIHTSKSSHVLDDKKSADIDEAIKRDRDALGLNAVQIFTHGPKINQPNAINYDLVRECTKHTDLVVHAAYTSSVIWRVTKETKSLGISKRYLRDLLSQLRICDEIGAWGLVLHINKLLPETIAETMHIVRPLMRGIRCKILLEMVALKSDPEKTYETPEKLNNLISLISDGETDTDYFGLCVDTAHIWAAGEDIKSYSKMKDWLNRIAYKDKLKLFHLNGSSEMCGGGRDKHEIPFSRLDKIWSDIEPSLSGARAVVEFAVKHGRTIIAEINRGDEKTARYFLNTVRKLAGE